MTYDPYQPREAEEPRSMTSTSTRGQAADHLRRRAAQALGADRRLVFLIWKLKFIFVAIFKFKLFTVAGSMLISVAAYALLWGWQFAAGFVVLLFVHELGHVFEAKRQGLPSRRRCSSRSSGR